MSAVSTQSTGIIVLMKCLLLGRKAVTEKKYFAEFSTNNPNFSFPLQH